MQLIVKFKTMLNVVWGTEINGKEAFAYVKGFPGTFILTERRALVVAQFIEKQGWFKKKTLHTLCFEAGLNFIKEYKYKFDVRQRTKAAYLSFEPHGQLGEGAMIQFVKMDPNIAKRIDEHLKNIKIKYPIPDTGIVHVDSMLPEVFLKKRFDKTKKWQNRAHLQAQINKEKNPIDKEKKENNKEINK